LRKKPRKEERARRELSIVQRGKIARALSKEKHRAGNQSKTPVKILVEGGVDRKYWRGGAGGMQFGETSKSSVESRKGIERDELALTSERRVIGKRSDAQTLEGRR